MNGGWCLFKEVSVEDLKTDSIDVHEDTELVLNLGREHFSPRGTNELLKSLEQSNLAVSDIDVFRVESPELGRMSTGSGDVYKRATDIQKQQEFGSKDVREAFMPEYVIVSAPSKELEDRDLGEASIKDTVEQLHAAQDTIRDVDEPVDFTGQLLLENRPDSILSSMEDLRRFRNEASKQGFDLTYCFNTAVENGREMLEEASSQEVGLVRMSQKG